MIAFFGNTSERGDFGELAALAAHNKKLNRP
jgi:hypothetical protein